MDNTSKQEHCLPSFKRKLIQLYSAILYNAHLRGFVKGEIFMGKSKAVCVPGFNCYSCPGAVGACPLGAIQNALASSGHRAGWYVLGIIMLYGLLLGRTICGWLCPLGLIQEILHKVPTPKLKKSRVTRALSCLKYVILVVFAGAIPFWYGIKHGMAVPGFCKYICPAGTFEGAIGLLSNPKNASLFSMLGILFTRKFVIMLIIGLACIFCYRSFCRFLCPLGAIYGLFNKFCLVGVKVDEQRCNGCGSCVRSCQMDVRHVGDRECINCSACMDVCPQGALSLAAGACTLKAPAKGCAGDTPALAAKRKDREKIAWGAALAVLCFALLWFNLLDPSVRRTAPSQKPAPAPAAETAETADTAQTAETADTTQTADTAQTAETAQTADTPADAAEAEHESAAAAENEGGDAPSEPASGHESGESTQYVSTAPVGTAIGDRMQDFSITCLDGSQFHLANKKGKVTIINMWATYCGPCVQELPLFDRLYAEHAGDVEILAVHASLVTEDVPEFLAGRDLSIPFAVDDENDTLFNLSGASIALLPQTVVLNRKGEIVYNQAGSVTYELLEELYQKAK